ncbi:metalloendopeptidase-like membrane protein [Aequorivita sublithincola DSM 14238]|uniref:Metalloendopeptidase-like membrane protein n=1 Tax=Aequorivita sublithincola (strain DSM 14238 / LMG 21431 / ACAM 643 / 9-3) TaxID=746697 RepID=I3YV49_AEQSU|nr:M23 family metallopeptidase [Aequorivita sublithincola]AFL80867.1 metalloendopeptidase-like membrane protein [Aequorivita sublithincola DSM 14238]
MNLRILFTLILLGILITSCKEEIRKAADIFVQPTAREVYERNFSKNDSLLLQWKKAFENSKEDNIQITLPYSESGIFSEENFNVYSYNMQLKEGERIVVQVEKQPDSASVFIDLFQQKSDSLKVFKLVKSSEAKSASLAFEIDKSAVYKVVVQPEMKRQIPFIIKIYAEPMYFFPVSGGTNKSVQSFWADPRGEGSRSHEGVDIFAARGTPVVAVSDGRITSTGEHGLGGKQVWLMDGIFGKRVYYAHLDSIAVTTGKRVKTGDTLGFVGNSGNAITTAPHLHFGIYRKNGAVNPYPYIKMADVQQVKDISKVVKGFIFKNRAELHKGPASVFEQLATLKKNDTVLVLGKNQDWFHIQTRDSLKGFINQSFLNELPLN